MPIKCPLNATIPHNTRGEADLSQQLQRIDGRMGGAEGDEMSGADVGRVKL